MTEEPRKQHQDESDGWVPAFPGQRPPFAPGHTLAVSTHGAYSPRKVDPLATELVKRVLADPDTAYLRSPSYAPALWAWGRAEAQVQLVTEYLAKEGEYSRDGLGDLDKARVMAAHKLLHQAEARAESNRKRLGLDPLSRARLGRDVTSVKVDLAKLLAEREVSP